MLSLILSNRLAQALALLLSDQRIVEDGHTNWLIVGGGVRIRIRSHRDDCRAESSSALRFHLYARFVFYVHRMTAAEAMNRFLEATEPITLFPPGSDEWRDACLKASRYAAEAAAIASDATAPILEQFASVMLSFAEGRVDEEAVRRIGRDGISLAAVFGNEFLNDSSEELLLTLDGADER